MEREVEIAKHCRDSGAKGMLDCDRAWQAVLKVFPTHMSQHRSEAGGPCQKFYLTPHDTACTQGTRPASSLL